MGKTIYATFADPEDAERAAGALLDHGVHSRDLSVVRSHRGEISDESRETNVERAAKEGISTTTPADAGAGAVKGAAWGLGVGAIAAVASLVLPGVGLVLGGGALAAALGGVAATTGAGAIAGAVTGYLKDQGVDEVTAQQYEHVVTGGGALLALSLPSGEVDHERAREVLSKYNAADLRGIEDHA